jgi:hypothetical protein
MNPEESFLEVQSCLERYATLTFDKERSVEKPRRTSLRIVESKRGSLSLADVINGQSLTFSETPKIIPFKSSLTTSSTSFPKTQFKPLNPSSFNIVNKNISDSDKAEKAPEPVKTPPEPNEISNAKEALFQKQKLEEIKNQNRLTKSDISAELTFDLINESVKMISSDISQEALATAYSRESALQKWTVALFNDLFHNYISFVVSSVYETQLLTVSIASEFLFTDIIAPCTSMMIKELAESHIAKNRCEEKTKRNGWKRWRSTLLVQREIKKRKAAFWTNASSIEVAYPTGENSLNMESILGSEELSSKLLQLRTPITKGTRRGRSNAQTRKRTSPELSPSPFDGKKEQMNGHKVYDFT